MREVSATEFARNFGQYREIVQREPVAVTSHGRTTGYFVSPVEYEELQRYKHLMQRSFPTKDLSAEHIAAIAGGHMAAEHDHLDALLENE